MVPDVPTASFNCSTRNQAGVIHDDPCIAEHPVITMASDWLLHPNVSDHGTSPRIAGTS